MCKYELCDKDKFELHLKMTNKTSARELVRIFFSQGSHSDHCKKVDDFWLYNHMALQAMIQVVASKKSIGRWLAARNLVRVWPWDILPICSDLCLFLSGVILQTLMLLWKEK